MIFKVYAIVAAAITFLLGVPLDIFSYKYSWITVPLVLIGVFFALILLHLIVLAVLIATVNLNKPSKDTNFFRRTVDGFLHIAFGLLRVRVHTSGLEKIPEDEPFLLVCNHIHDLDPAIIYYAVPDARLAFIAKKDLRGLMPFIYRALHKLSGLPIDRENNREAAKTIINATHLIKNGTNSVAVFPEGYTSKTGELQPMRNGAFKIATKAQCKIAVCTVWDTRQIVKNLFRRKTDIYFSVLEVIDTKDKSHTVDIGQQVYDLMQKSLNEVKNKI